MTLELADKAPIIRKANDLEEQRWNLEDHIKEIDRHNHIAKAATHVTEAEVKRAIQ